MSSTLSDPYLVVAFWTGLGAMGATLLLAAQVVRLRIGLRRAQAMRRRSSRRSPPRSACIS